METETRVAAIIIRDDKILMLRGKGHEELWTPGGHLEIGESEEKCLKRELKEEIGVNLLKLEFLGIYPGKSFYQPEKTYNQHIYLVEIEGKITPDAEIKDFLWFSKEDFLSKKYPMITNDEEEVIPDLIKRGIW